MTPFCGPSTCGELIPSKTSGPLARDPLPKLTGPRGRFFLSVFRDPRSVAVWPWFAFEAIVAPFSCTSDAGTRASVQSARRPWSFGRAFHVVTCSAAESVGAAETITRRPWSFGRIRWTGGRGLLQVAPVFLHVARRCLVQVAPVFLHVARRPWFIFRIRWPAGRRPWFGGAGVCISTNKQGPPAPSRGLWIEWPAACFQDGGKKSGVVRVARGV